MLVIHIHAHKQFYYAPQRPLRVSADMQLYRYILLIPHKHTMCTISPAYTSRIQRGCAEWASSMCSPTRRRNIIEAVCNQLTTDHEFEHPTITIRHEEHAHGPDEIQDCITAPGPQASAPTRCLASGCTRTLNFLMPFHTYSPTPSRRDQIRKVSGDSGGSRWS